MQQLIYNGLIQVNGIRFFLSAREEYRMGMGGTAPVHARPPPMVAGGRVLGEDGRGRAVTGPIPITEPEMPPVDKQVLTF
jgi:hypothetical protein